MSRILLLSIALALLSSALVRAGNDKSVTHQVTIKDMKFDPENVEIAPGDTVVWTNQDDIEHSVMSGTPENRDGRFDVRLTGKGTNGGVEFGKTGVYPYFCDRHQSMRGEIRVN